MVKDFTPNSLVSFLYHETSSIENKMIEQVIADDVDMYDEFRLLQEAKSALPKAQFRPSAKAINNILRYSKNSAIMA